MDSIWFVVHYLLVICFRQSNRMSHHLTFWTSRHTSTSPKSVKQMLSAITSTMVFHSERCSPSEREREIVEFNLLGLNHVWKFYSYPHANEMIMSWCNSTESWKTIWGIHILFTAKTETETTHMFSEAYTYIWYMYSKVPTPTITLWLTTLAFYWLVYFVCAQIEKLPFILQIIFSSYSFEKFFNNKQELSLLCITNHV